MGFWSSVGKFAGKTALGIIAPGALAGYEWQKAKETREVLKDLDEAIETIFQSLANIQDDDSWKELLGLVRGGVVQCLSNKNTREELLKACHPDEKGRVCCTLAALFCEKLPIVQPTVDRDRLKVLQTVLDIAGAICAELDKRIASASLTENEESVVRFFFDMMWTMRPYESSILYGQRNDISEVLSVLLKDVFFSEENEAMSEVLKSISRKSNVSFVEIRRKMGA